MCRIHKYYPISHSIDGMIRYIATLDGKKPVEVTYNHFANEHCYSEVINLFEIIALLKKHIPLHEDWFICKQAGFDFDEDIRNRDMRKYTKGLVYQILLRLCHHKIFNCFNPCSIIRHSWDGEINSYFRPFKTIYVNKRERQVI